MSLTGLPFLLSFGDGIEYENLGEWDIVIATLGNACTSYDIPLAELVLHRHGDEYPQGDHPLGLTTFSERSVQLCRPDILIALHELSHVWLNEAHSKDWAMGFFALMKQYTPDVFDTEVWTVANSYPQAMVAAREMVHDGIIPENRKFGWNSGYSPADT